MAGIIIIRLIQLSEVGNIIARIGGQFNLLIMQPNVRHAVVLIPTIYKFDRLLTA